MLGTVFNVIFVLSTVTDPLTLGHNLSKSYYLMNTVLVHDSVRVWPEVIGSLPLAESTPWNHTDPSFLQQFEAVQHVRSHGQRLQIHTNRNYTLSCLTVTSVPKTRLFYSAAFHPATVWSRVQGNTVQAVKTLRIHLKMYVSQEERACVFDTSWREKHRPRAIFSANKSPWTGPVSCACGVSGLRRIFHAHFKLMSWHAMCLTVQAQRSEPSYWATPGPLTNL